MLSNGFIRRFLVCGIVACASLTAADLHPAQEAELKLDHGLHGDQEVRLLAGDMSGAFGCQIHYEHYQPAHPSHSANIILAHGFMRKLKHMRGWAEHWSSWGLPTTLISLCNSTLLNGHHQRNADDLRHLARQLYPQQSVIFSGFSAGGLAAWLAANSYPKAAGYLGLDPVDSGKLGQRSADPRAIPGLVLYARPSMCNARNNFLPIVREQALYTIASIVGASHCHFESPYDRRCAWVCGGPSEGKTSASIERNVLSQTTRWLLSVAASQMSMVKNPKGTQTLAGER